MKNSLMRKAAEVKSALVSKEAAVNTVEMVLIVLGVIIIATLVFTGLKKVLGDESTGILKTISDKLTSWAGGTI